MTVEVQFKEKFNKLFEHLAQPGKQVVDNDIRSLLFGDYMAGKEEEKLYDEIHDLELLREVRGAGLRVENRPSCRNDY